LTITGASIEGNEADGNGGGIAGTNVPSAWNFNTGNINANRPILGGNTATGGQSNAVNLDNLHGTGANPPRVVARDNAAATAHPHLFTTPTGTST